MFGGVLSEGMNGQKVAGNSRRRTFARDWRLLVEASSTEMAQMAQMAEGRGRRACASWKEDCRRVC